MAANACWLSLRILRDRLRLYLRMREDMSGMPKVLQSDIMLWIVDSACSVDDLHEIQRLCG
jgi:hypothetical protein